MGATRAQGRPWLAAGGGVIVGAAVAVGALVAMGWSAEGSPSAGGSSQTLTLPQTANGLRTEAAVAEELGGGPQEERAEALAETAELLSQSRGGVPAAVQAYADEELLLRPTVWAVAEESPPLWTSQEGEATAKLLHITTPMEWVERADAAEDGSQTECLVRAINPIREGNEGEPETTITHCQLVVDDLTVILQGSDLDSVDTVDDILRDVAANLEIG